MGWEEVVIWAGRGLLYAGKPMCRKAAPSKKERLHYPAFSAFFLIFPLLNENNV